MKKVIFLFVFIFISTHFYAQDNPLVAPSNNCTQTLSGIVKDLKSSKLVSNVFIQLYDGLVLIDSAQTDAASNFSFKVICNKRFNIKAKAENYAINSKIVFSLKSYQGKIWEVLLYPIREFKYRVPDKLIDIDNITFVVDQPTFTLKTRKQLDKVASIMEKYPKIRVSINVHTDSNGIVDYNLKMTQDRAERILNYLIDKGIDSKRLGAIGFGSTQLLNNCTPDVKCFESEHTINRRTEFVVM